MPKVWTRKSRAPGPEMLTPAIEQLRKVVEELNKIAAQREQLVEAIGRRFRCKERGDGSWSVFAKSVDGKPGAWIAIAPTLRDAMAQAKAFDERQAKSERIEKQRVEKRAERQRADAELRAAAAARIRKAAEERVARERDEKDAAQLKGLSDFAVAKAATESAKAMQALASDVADLAASVAGGVKNAPAPTRKRVKKTVVRDKSGRIVEVIEDVREMER